MCRLNNTTNKSKQKKKKTTWENEKGWKNKRELNFSKHKHTHSKPKQAPPFWTDSVWFHPLTNTYTHHVANKNSSIYLSHSFELTFSHARGSKKETTRANNPTHHGWDTFHKRNKKIPILSHVTQQVLSKQKVNKHNYYDHNKLTHIHPHTLMFTLKMIFPLWNKQIKQRM